MNLQNYHRKQGVVEVVRSIALTCSAIALASCGKEPSELVVHRQPEKSRPTFGDWCRNRKNLSPEAKHTVEVLLEKAKTTECDVADQELSNFTQLSLSRSDYISDLKPLEFFTKLQKLNLGGDKISNITPLQSLTDLTDLSISGTQISDLKPLRSLNNLTGLSLRSNKISHLKPLESLTKLTKLDLSVNQIRDIKPLASLTNLTELYLQDNQISDLRPLEPLTNLTALYIDKNQINDIIPL